MKNFLLILLSVCCIAGSAISQNTPESVNARYFDPEDKPFNFRFTLTAYFMINGGGGFSVAAGSWVNNEFGLQPSLTSSINFSFHGNNLGNARFYHDKESGKADGEKRTWVNPNRMVVTVIFSPLLTVSLDNAKTYLYDEINPFYFGTSSTIYNNYRHAVTLGTSFVTLPRGTYDNMMTSRNRTQQLVYVQMKFKDFQFNLYEDFFGFTNLPVFQWLCDNRDRYYTGGANVQLRIAEFYKIKYYAETYTGTSYIDKQDFPDTGYPDDIPSLMYHRAEQIHQKYAYQDPGQQSFNKSRNFLCFETSLFALMSYNKGEEVSPYPDYNMDLQFYIGRQGGRENMWTQNFIHNKMPISRDNKNGSEESRLHQFDYRDNFFAKYIFGFGTTVSY